MSDPSWHPEWRQKVIANVRRQVEVRCHRLERLQAANRDVAGAVAQDDIDVALVALLEAEERLLRTELEMR